MKNGQYNKYSKNYKKTSKYIKTSSTSIVVIKQMRTQKMKINFYIKLEIFSFTILKLKNWQRSEKRTPHILIGNVIWYHLSEIIQLYIVGLKVVLSVNWDTTGHHLQVQEQGKILRSSYLQCISEDPRIYQCIIISDTNSIIYMFKYAYE